jgi:multidrug efflux pump subunit AcrA (membrane-fusion protein)
VRPETPVGGELEAKVMVVDSLIDAASGTFGVRLELPNPGRRIPAGLRCRIEFPKIGGAGLGAAPVGLRGDGSARPAVAPTRH